MKINKVVIIIICIVLSSGVCEGQAKKLVTTELVRDRHFQSGFKVMTPQRPRIVEDTLDWDDTDEPAWVLAQWWSKYSIKGAKLQRPDENTVVYSNPAKSITVAKPGSESGDIVLAVDTQPEYNGKYRQKGQSWPHLLVSQKFAARCPLISDIKTLKYHIEAKLLYNETIKQPGYDTKLHCAHILQVLTVRNINRESPGYGDFIWFSLPIYDNRYEFSPKHIAPDTGHSKMIYGLDTRSFMSESTHSGKWVTIDKDIYPLIIDGLNTAWEKGYLKDSKRLKDYKLASFILGWEVPGINNVAIQLRNCSLVVSTEEKDALNQNVNATQEMKNVRVSEDQSQFVLEHDSTSFVPWGFNYDHDRNGRLLEDYWFREWLKIEEDFGEMKELGANVVRIHLQLGKFMNTPEVPNEAALNQLARLIRLAEKLNLYLDITGLGCYHKKDVPIWYDGLSETQRWDVQVRFWEAIARCGAKSPAIFCYDLMNEPVLTGPNKKVTDWLLGELGGKYFVQRINLDPAGRTREQIAKAWVDKLVTAIRKHDNHHMITVGIIPWAHTFPGAKPLFYSRDVAENLDFVSVHFYPKKGEVDKALTALAVYDIGKPVVIEEMFPLSCSISELESFIDESQKVADGWISFYWGKTIEEYRQNIESKDFVVQNSATLSLLELFSRKANTIRSKCYENKQSVR